MSGSDWTHDEPDDRFEARPVNPPAGFEPPDEPAPSLARTPEPAAPRSDLAPEVPDEADEAPPSRLRALIHAGLAILAKLPRPSLGSERHEHFPTPDEVPAGLGSAPESEPDPDPDPEPRPSRFAVGREARVGIAAVLSFALLVGALVFKKGGIGKPVPLAMNPNVEGEPAPEAPEASKDPAPIEPDAGKDKAEGTPPAPSSSPTPTPTPPTPTAPGSGLGSPLGDASLPPSGDPPGPGAMPAASPIGREPESLPPPEAEPATSAVLGAETPAVMPPSLPSEAPAAKPPEPPPSPVDPLPIPEPAPSTSPALPVPEPAESPTPMPTAEPSPTPTPTAPPVVEPQAPPKVEATSPPPATPTPVPTLEPVAAPVLAGRPLALESVPAALVEPAATRASTAGALGAGWLIVPSGGRRIAGVMPLVSTPAEERVEPPASRVADGPRVADDPASADQVEPVVHEVQAGENFYTISKLYYHSGRFYKALHAANRKQVPDIKRLYIGTVLRIPPPEALDRSLIEPASRTAADDPKPSTISRTSKRAEPAADEGADLAMPSRRRIVPAQPEAEEAPRRPTHTVKPHETLRSIARDLLDDPKRYREIYNLNRDVLDDTNILPAGTVLTLPDDASTGRKAR